MWLQHENLQQHGTEYILISRDDHPSQCLHMVQLGIPTIIQKYLSVIIPCAKAQDNIGLKRNVMLRHIEIL